MRNFRIIQSSPEELYWYGLFKYTSPYAEIGATVIELAKFFSENDLNTATQQLSRKLDELSVQIRQLREFIETKLDDIVLREHSGDVLGIKEALEEYIRLRSQGILDNIVTHSAQTKSKIEAYLSQDQTPIYYYHAYNTLKCMLLPVRVTCFMLYGRPSPDTSALVRDELHDLLANKERGVEVARVIGRNRVSYEEEVFLFDELGPTWGTEFGVTVDGRRVYGDMFAPGERDLNEKRQRAQQKYKEFQEKKADEVSQGIRKCYDDAQQLLDQIGAQS